MSHNSVVGLVSAAFSFLAGKKCGTGMINEHVGLLHSEFGAVLCYVLVFVAGILYPRIKSQDVVVIGALTLMRSREDLVSIFNNHLDSAKFV